MMRKKYLIAILVLIIISTLELKAQGNAYKFTVYGISDGLSQSSVEGILQDSRGFLWIGTGDGLDKFDGYGFTVYKSEPGDTSSLSDNWISRILFEDGEGDIWMRTSDGLVNCYIYKTNNFRRFRIGDGTLISSFTEDRNNNLWLGTNKGLFQLEKRNGNVIRYCNQPGDINSLSNDTVYSLFQDRYNLLWIGTAHGLNKFNPINHSFIRYSPQGGFHASLVDQAISGFFKDKNHTLWVVSSTGISKWDSVRRQFQPFRLIDQVETKKKKDFIRSMVESRDGFIWIGTTAGLFRMDKNTGTINKFVHQAGDPQSLSSNEIFKLYLDKKDQLWVCTANGLNQWISSDGNFRIYYYEDNIPGAHIVSRIIQDKNGEYWALGELDMNRGAPLFHLDLQQSELVQIHSSTCAKNGLSTDYVYYPVEDKTGNLWFGTFGAGLIRLTPRIKKFELYEASGDKLYALSGNTVFSFCEDPSGKIWISLVDKGMDCYDPSTGRFQHYYFQKKDPRGFPESSIMSIVCDEKGIIYLGTLGRGLVALNPSTGIFKYLTYQSSNENSQPDNYIRSLYLDQHGKIWIGTAHNGVSIFDPLRNTYFNLPHVTKGNKGLMGISIWNISGDKKGNVWIASEGFVERYNPENKEVFRYKSKSIDSTGVTVDKTLCVFEDHAGRMWFGTLGGGLALLNEKTGRFNFWTEKRGLANNTVYGILEDNHFNLWMSTNRGLTMFNYQTGEFRNYHSFDGLQAEEFNMNAYYKTRAGKMLFGGINGFNSFFPEMINNDTIAPKTLITGLKIFNKEVGILEKVFSSSRENRKTGLIFRNGRYYLPMQISCLKELVLRYKEKMVAIEFAGLYFNHPEKNTYKYRMRNFEDDWIYSGTDKTATYTNLTPGVYYFEVTSANADGIWNTKPVVLKIIILPPFWRTWWFITLESLLVAYLLFAFIRFREQKHARTTMILEKKVQARTREINDKNAELTLRNELIEKQKEEILFQAEQLKTELMAQNQLSELALLRSQINPHFLFNTLNNIYSLVYQKADSASEAVMKLSELMRYILYDANHDQVLLEKEINFLKSYIDLQMLRLKNKELVQFVTNGDTTGRTIAPMLFIPFVENAFKHGLKNGQDPGITINLLIEPQSITFDVANAYKETTMNKDSIGGIGLQNLQRRLDLLYPRKYKLEIVKLERMFKTKLEIES